MDELYWMEQGFRMIGFGILAFMAILFLQSGIDKITDWKGNLEWLTGHFEKSPLAGMVPTLLGVLAFTETAGGLLSVVALGGLILFQSLSLPILALIVAICNFLMLFFGQRMAKDYAGAAGIVPYFIVALLGMAFFVFSGMMLGFADMNTLG